MSCVKLLKEQILMIEKNPISLATVNKKLEPHVILVAFAKVRDNKLIITDNYMVKTKKNIKENMNVSLVLYNKKWNGLYLDGIARYYTKGKYYEFVKGIKENKNEPCKGVIVIILKSIKRMF